MKQGWEIKKLGEVFDLQMGKTPSRDNSDYWGGANVWVAISDLQDKYIGDSKEYITDKALSETKIKKVKAGTTIMSFKLSVGRAAITTKDLYTNEAIMAFNLNDGYNLIADYIYYYLKGYKWQGANKAVMGITLNKASISQNHIVIPPLVEQEKIVEELDCLSGIIERKREQLKQLDALAQSIFYQMFGDPTTNEKGWQVKKWNDVLTITNGKNQKAVENPNGVFPIYGSGGIMGYADKYLCPKNTIVIGRKGNINKPIFVKEPFWNVDTAFGLIADNTHIAPSYLFFYCRIFDFEQLNKAVTIPSLTKSDLLLLEMPCPPIHLQQEFAEKIEAIEKQKELIKKSISETENLFNARMDYYFN